jgi:hypothetical protein
MAHPQITPGEDGLQTWLETGKYGISSREHPARDSPPTYGFGRGRGGGANNSSA